MEISILVGIGLAIAVVLFLLQKSLKNELASISKTMGDELKNNRQELNQSLFQMRSEASKSNKDLSEVLLSRFNDFATVQRNALEKLQELLRIQDKTTRELLVDNLEKVRKDNEIHLEKIRNTVDEKLHTHLEKKLGESFKQVSERLELVHKGLGEMRNLADGVGDLKRVLTNVKTKGTLGEYQLENILDQILAEDQFVRNAETKKNSGARVEFAIKIPQKSGDGFIYLPIDSKFPTTNYEILLEAKDSGDKEVIKKAQALFNRSIKNFAKDISEKYISPPDTTEFGIMFLPIEGIYAEVVNDTELFHMLQNELKICVAGPTTLSAFLNSLQMGFKTLALEKRSSEVWKVLSATKTEFSKFGEILDKVEKKLNEAQNVIGQSKTRSRAIFRKLQDVESLPVEESDQFFLE